MTFVILTHNEETVFRLLDQLIGQRVVIIDDESKEEYRRRLEDHAAKPIVVVRHLLLNFAAQRNYANTLIGQEWIFMIDADETLEFRASTMAEMLDNIASSGIDTISVRRRNVVYKSDGRREEFEENHIRGYRNIGLKWKGPVHEAMQPGAATLKSSFCIRHEKTEDHQKNQHDFYSLLNSKILLSYCVTESVRDAFVCAQIGQQRLPSNCKQLIVSEAPLGSLNISPYFVVNPEIGSGESLNLSRQRNLAIRYAIENGFDWLVILDCDSLVLDIKKMPSSGYGTAWVWWQEKGELLSKVSRDKTDRWTERSWFILGRDVFTQPWCRFDEGYVGYGFQDWDFHEHVVTRNGIQRTESDIRAVHLWHAPRSAMGSGNSERFHRKRDEYALANHPQTC